MTDDATHPQPSGGTGAGPDPWAPPESGPSLEKSSAPPSVHDQVTVTSVPSDSVPPPPGNAGPGYGYPGSGLGGPAGSVPPPPLAPGGPGGPVGYGYPNYSQGYGGWPAQPLPPQNGMGVAAMVLGILSCAMFCLYGVLSLVLGVIAIVLGVKGRKKAERGEATNHGQAQAGFIMGIIGTILGIAVIVFMVVVIVTAINSDDESDYYYDGSLHASPVAQQY